MSDTSEPDPYPASESEYELSTNDDKGSSTDTEQETSASTSNTNRKGRKRFREPQHHVGNVRKRHRNSGLPYSTKKGKNIDGKHFTNQNCNCRLKCFDRITRDDRMKAFNTFWKIGSFSGQNAYLCGLIQINNVKQKRPRNNSRQPKSCSNTYLVHINSKSVRVCKSYFLKTFQISDGRMMRVIRKIRESSPGEDLRGTHPPSNKTSDELRKSVRDHINAFPSYQSLYTRTHNPKRRYISSELNIRLMYNLYVEKCHERNEQKVSEAIYRQIFHKDFNLHFHTPSKDTCTRCDTFKMKMDTETDPNKKNEYKVQHTLHLHDAWDETMASRGSQEISSWQRKYISTYVSSNEHIIAYSDACTGQNRNIKMSLMWLQMVSEFENVKVIEHKFLVSGHSYLPKDRDFGSIETYAKGKNVHVADDWFRFIKKSRSKKPFSFYKMQTTDFLSTKNLEQAICRRKKNEDNDPVNWLKIQWLRFEKDNPYKIFYKETLNTDIPFYCINLLPAKKGRPPAFQNISLDYLYSDSIPVSIMKKQNMLELLQFIPPIHHDFFKNLKTVEQNNADDIGPLEKYEENDNNDN